MSRVRSMRGVEVNMAALVAQHADAVAVGNAKMNARGDLIGAGGRVIKPREQIASEYYASNPKAVVKQQVSLNDLRGEIMTPAEAVAAAQKAAQNAPAPPARKRRVSEGD